MTRAPSSSHAAEMAARRLRELWCMAPRGPKATRRREEGGSSSRLRTVAFIVAACCGARNAICFGRSGSHRGADLPWQHVYIAWHGAQPHEAYSHIEYAHRTSRWTAGDTSRVADFDDYRSGLRTGGHGRDSAAHSSAAGSRKPNTVVALRSIPRVSRACAGHARWITRALDGAYHTSRDATHY